jgi:succinyl-diaminopimelate desuccinylase
MSAIGEALMARTAELVNVASVSRAESDLADLVLAELRDMPGLSLERVGDNVVASTVHGATTRVLFGGHLDTVPPSGNERAHREGPRLSGVGAADMKGGLAVMLALANTAAARDCDTTFVFYAREEIARKESGLLELHNAIPAALDCDVALLLEPTGAVVEAGCQGSLRVEIALGGTKAHSARPWTGRNAIHRLGAVIDRIAEFGEHRPMIDGCEYRESLQAVGISGGGVGNVVPDAATVLVNYRFAPDKSVDEAIASLKGRFDGILEESTRSDRFTVIDAAPPAPPSLHNAVLEQLVANSGAPPRAKLAWTDVAFFSERGIPAANFGPGDPLIAHHADEFVVEADLVRVFEVLDAVLDRTS